MSQSNDRLLQIADTLEHINEQLVLLAIDTEHYAMALQAVQTNDPVSNGVIQAVISALFRDSLFATDASEQMDNVLSMPELEVSGTSRLADGSILLQIDAIPGRSYQVETSPDLSSWTTVPIPIQAGATRIHYIDHALPPDGAKRFYRVREITR